MNVFSRGVRNAFRNPIRTVSIVIILGLSMGLALAMLVAHQAVTNKIDSVKSSVGNTIVISPAGVRGFEGGGNALTTDQLESVKKLDHVSAVNETLNDRLTSENTNLVSAIDAGSLGHRNAGNNGQTFTAPDGDGFRGRSGNGTISFTPPVQALGTTDPTKLANSIGGGTFSLVSGQVYDAGSTENVAVIGKDLATKNNLSVGSTFTAYGQAIKVVAIYDSGNTFSNNQVIMPLTALQTLSNQLGQVTGATVTVDSITNIDSTTTAVKNSLGTNADVTNSAEEAKTTLEPLQNIQRISLYSLIGAIIAGAVIILLTMVMIVRERRREIGVLKAIGASNIKIILQFMTEAITLTILASFIGILLGFLAGNPITHMLVTNASNQATSPAAQAGGRAVRFMARGPLGGVRENLTGIHGVVSWTILLYGLAAATLIAVLGSTLASFLIAKVRPAEVMRTE